MKEMIGLLEVVSVESTEVTRKMERGGMMKRIDEFNGVILSSYEDLEGDSASGNTKAKETLRGPGGNGEGYGGGSSQYGKRVKDVAVGRRYVYPMYLKEMVTVGRDENTCNLVIDHPATSSVHAHIWSVSFDSHTEPLVYLNDQSRNGVYVNGAVVGRGQTTILREGDQIQIKKAVEFKYSRFPRTERDASISLPLLKIKDWTICNEIIGSGSYGSVYVCRRSNTAKLHAVKIIKNVGSAISMMQEKDKIRNEANILMRTNHPNIIKIHEAIFVSNSLYLFEDLVCGGDLFSYLTTGDSLRPIPEKEVILIVFQILKALDYLHNKLSVIHRDLKLDNVLLEAPIPCSRVYLCDFGIAKSLKHLNQRSQTVVGTVEYSAPEIFVDHLSPSNFGIKDQYDSDELTSSAQPSSSAEKEGYTYKCDSWSLGVMVHIMLSGISPFYADGNNQNIIRNAVRGNIDLNRPSFSSVSSGAKKFISSLLQTDPVKRASVDQCFTHPWINHNRINLELLYKDKIIGS